MSYKGVVTKIDELRALVDGWSGDAEPAALEMDMALERVKSIYEMLRFPVKEQQPETEQVDETPMAAEFVEEEIEEVCEQIAAEPEIEEAAAAEFVEEQIETDEVTEATETEAEEESVEDEDIHLDLVNVTPLADDQSEQSEMIDIITHNREIAEIAAQKRERLNKILSLYDQNIGDDEMDLAQSETEFVEEEVEDEVEQVIVEEQESEESVVPTVEPQVEEIEQTEQTEQIEETEQPEEQTEQIEQEEQPAQEITPTLRPDLDPLQSLLSLNDRILLMQELFDGDSDNMVEVLATLDVQPTLDDAMIYIAENYSWSGDNDGAKLLMSLLQNRYQS